MFKFNYRPDTPEHHKKEIEEEYSKLQKIIPDYLYPSKPINVEVIPSETEPSYFGYFLDGNARLLTPLSNNEPHGNIPAYQLHGLLAHKLIDEHENEYKTIPKNTPIYWRLNDLLRTAHLNNKKLDPIEILNKEINRAQLLQKELHHDSWKKEENSIRNMKAIVQSMLDHVKHPLTRLDRLNEYPEKQKELLDKLKENPDYLEEDYKSHRE